MTGIDWLLYYIQFSQRDNCKLRWIYLNGKNQIKANMAKVFSLIQEESYTGSVLMAA